MDPRLEEKFQFNGRDIEIFINDRMIAPNSVGTIETIDADLQVFCKKLFSGKEYSISYNPDPRALLTAKVRAAQPYTVANLLEALA